MSSDLPLLKVREGLEAASEMWTKKEGGKGCDTISRGEEAWTGIDEIEEDESFLSDLCPAYSDVRSPEGLRKGVRQSYAASRGRRR